MIDFNKAIALWFMDVSDSANWLAGISREDDGTLLLQWRMRYFKPGTAPDSVDEKHWYEGTTTDSESAAIEKLRLAGRMLTRHGCGKMYELLRGNKSNTEFFEEFRSMPWAHVSRVEVTT